MSQLKSSNEEEGQPSVQFAKSWCSEEVKTRQNNWEKNISSLSFSVPQSVLHFDTGHGQNKIVNT